ncbi:hypothetical protein IDH14_02045 [Pelagibacterales bacterium SAG-MED33]|nr:hypothetical protein [Pelagibacterales bacterium SAG-MED33]
MIKKIILSVFLFLFLTSCGFTPLYSNKEMNDINIEVLNYEGDRDINLYLVSKLRAISNTEGKLFKVKIITNYEKIILTNNLANEPEEYQLSSNVEFTVIENNSEKKFGVSEKFVMKNLIDDFEERNYEKSIKKNMTNLIYTKFLIQIKKLK